MSSIRTPAAAGPRPLRLTRRGRALVLSVLVVVVFLAAAAFGRATSQAGVEPTGTVTRAITVEAGQTLWGIALDVAPQADPRATIERLRELNGLGTDVVQAGQRLVVPA